MRIADFLSPLLTASFTLFCISSAFSQENRFTELEHFRIEHHGQFSARDLLEVRRYLMNVRREVGRDFAGCFPAKKISVVLTDPNLFQTELTMPETVSGLFNGKIHLPIPGDHSQKFKVEGVLWHEYTHALIYDVAGNNAPRWFSEGMAVYQETKRRNNFTQRNSMIASSDLIVFDLYEIEHILSSGQYDEKMLGAYQSAYLYCEYLWNRFPKKKHRNFLEYIKHSGDWTQSLRDVYHLEISDMDQIVKEKHQNKIN